MIERDNAQLREQILEILGSGSSGVVQLALIIFLMFGVIGASLAMLGLLRRELPRVALTAPRWGWGEVILGISGWYLFQILLGSLAFVLLEQSPEGLLGSIIQTIVRPPIQLVVQLTVTALAGLLVTAGVLALPKLTRQPFEVLGIGTGSLFRGAWIGTLAWLCFLPGGIAIAVGWNSLLILSGVDSQPQQLISIYGDAIENNQWALLSLIGGLAVIVAPIAEEFLFRVLLFRWLTARAGLAAGIVISSLLFGLIHLSLSAFLPIVALGALLAAIYHHTGNVWTCIVLHAVFNGVQLLLMLLMLLLF